MQYFVTCAMGEDLFNMRKVVREKATAIIKERQIEISAAPSLLARRCAKGRSRGFLPCSEVVCAYRLGLPPGSPLPGAA